MEILTKYAVEIFFGLISAALLGFCKHLISKNKQLEEMQKADQNRQYRQMIVDEIEPIIDEIKKISKVFVAPHEMLEKWEKSHAIYVEKSAWIKQMLSM